MTNKKYKKSSEEKLIDNLYNQCLDNRELSSKMIFNPKTNYISEILKEFDNKWYKDYMWASGGFCSPLSDLKHPFCKGHKDCNEEHPDPTKIKEFLKQKLQEIEKKEYEKGFTAGADTTGRQAREIYAIEIKETLKRKVDEIRSEIEKLNIFQESDGGWCGDEMVEKDEILDLKSLKHNK